MTDQKPSSWLKINVWFFMPDHSQLQRSYLAGLTGGGLPSTHQTRCMAIALCEGSCSQELSHAFTLSLSEFLVQACIFQAANLMVCHLEQSKNGPYYFGHFVCVCCVLHAPQKEHVDWTGTPWSGTLSLNQWTVREIPVFSFTWDQNHSDIFILMCGREGKILWLQEICLGIYVWIQMCLIHSIAR